MRKVVVTSWQEASDYLKGGRDPNDRPVDAYLRLIRVDPNDPDSQLRICYKHDKSIWEIGFNKDGSIDINNPYRGQSRIINQYGKAHGVNNFVRSFKLQIWLPSMGQTKSRSQKCSNCDNGSEYTRCNGPAVCMEVIHNFPQHLRDTGAPGVQCSHFENDVHILDKCDHGQSNEHRVINGRNCWRCHGKGKIQTRPRLLSEEWDGSPIRIKNGQIVQLGQAAPSAA